MADHAAPLNDALSLDYRARPQASALSALSRSDFGAMARTRRSLLPACLDDWIDEENLVRAIDALSISPASGSTVEARSGG
jgi:hypothetical protein